MGDNGGGRRKGNGSWGLGKFRDGEKEKLLKIAFQILCPARRTKNFLNNIFDV